MAIDTVGLSFGNLKRSLPETAALIAYVAHQGQSRKESSAPYFIHPVMVAMKVRAYGFDDVTVATALVHDVLEDSEITREQLLELLGQDVLELVLLLSENKSLVWEKRKEQYIATISQAPNNVKAISAADKIHNLNSLFAAYDVQGAVIWQVFNRGKEAKYWFEKNLLQALKSTWQHPLVDEYAVLVARLEKLQA